MVTAGSSRRVDPVSLVGAVVVAAAARGRGRLVPHPLELSAVVGGLHAEGLLLLLQRPPLLSHQLLLPGQDLHAVLPLQDLHLLLLLQRIRPLLHLQPGHVHRVRTRHSPSTPPLWLLRFTDQGHDVGADDLGGA